LERVPNGESIASVRSCPDAPFSLPPRVGGSRSARFTLRGLVSVHAMTGITRGRQARVQTCSHPRPRASIRIRGPVASGVLASALLDTDRRTRSPASLAGAARHLLGGERQTIRWRGERFWVEFHTVEIELAQRSSILAMQARVGFTRGAARLRLTRHRGCFDCFLTQKFCGARSGCRDRGESGFFGNRWAKQVKLHTLRRIAVQSGRRDPRCTAGTSDA